MLDVTARSFRGRICEYRNPENCLETPAVLRTVEDECDEPAYISLKGGNRTLCLFGKPVPLDGSLLTSAASGVRVPPEEHGSVSVVRLPLPEDLEFSESVETVVLANAYELRNNPRLAVDTAVRLRTAAGYGRIIMAPGLAEPSTLALLTYMGFDVFDDALCTALGRAGKKAVCEGIFERTGDLSEENREELMRELDKTKDFIRGGRLRELVDQRASASPQSVAQLRVFDDEGYVYQEETVDTAAGRFCCNTTQSLRRPDVLRYRKRIMENYRKPAHKRILVLLPCSAKKPYHVSKTHKRFATAIHFNNIETAVHEVIITSPLGIVPRELDVCYPANSYDIPVTGEWKCQEKQFIREMLAHLLEQGYDKVICHLGEDAELVRGLCEMEETVVGDSVSPASLQNLEAAIREAGKGMEVGDYMEDRRETVRSVLSFQFGPEIADRFMDEDTYAVGRFPYWKILRGKVQLGMMSEERGAVSLTMDGADILGRMGVHTVDMQDFELKGNLFAVGVDRADPDIRIGDEAIIMRNGEPVGVGVAMMSGTEMTQMKRGIAVKVRHKRK